MIFLDELGGYGQKLKYSTRTHLLPEVLETWAITELKVFAAKLGLRDAYLADKPKPHYPVVGQKLRVAAVQNGVITLRTEDWFYWAVQAKRRCFVFNSNPAGWHSKGAALHAALRYGAIEGQGEGPQGSSYAIPTKGIPLPEVRRAAKRFIKYSYSQPETVFFVTNIGHEFEDEMRSVFQICGSNCISSRHWFLRKTTKKRVLQFY